MDLHTSVDEILNEIQNSGNSTSDDKPKYNNTLYKKWFKSKTQSGFVSIRPWFQGMKFSIDIGKTNPSGKLESSTNCFVDAVDFAAYLRAIVTGNAVTNFPANERMGTSTPESFVSYGGSTSDGQPISRIFKAQYWQSGENVDPSAFMWKIGHFKARKSDSGAFIPDMKSPLSVDSIKVTRQDIVSISYLLDLALTSHVVNTTDWYDA
jgi:hypothetical protein